MRMWKRFALAALFLLWGCLTQAAPVGILAGSSGLPPGERRFAQSLANHAARWLGDEGVAVRMVQEANLDKTAKDCRVLVWIAPAELTPAQMIFVRTFVAGGGKLVVCYSNAKALADLMGVELLGYRKTADPKAWREMRFKHHRPRGVPNQIAQTSSNLLAIRPKGKGSSVLATWSSGASGDEGKEVAWIATPTGWWCSHVLLADGDATAKSALLLALCAAADKTIWKSAAEKRLADCRERLSRTNLKRRIRTLPGARAERLTQRLNEVERTLQEAKLEIGRGQPYTAWRRVQVCRQVVAELYGAVQESMPGEIRGVWDHSGVGLYPGDWPRTCRLLRDAGLTDLYVNVAGAGFAHYGSTVLPRSRVFSEYGDQLRLACAAAHAAGLRVHAWLLCFSTERATPERIDWFRRKGWLLKDSQGRTRNWLEPADREVQRYLLQAVQELSSYPVDGVHLDFVRYPDGQTSLEGDAKRKWQIGRRARITDFVQAAAKTSRRNGRRVPLSAAVYGKYPSCVWAVGQDWLSWIRLGFVANVLPMNYTQDQVKYQEWLTQQTANPAVAKRVVSGIGVTAAESRLDAIDVIEQINLARRFGTAGFALFDLDATLRNEILPVLRLGVTNRR
ncbi:MAG: family 10 glycosylhydrolase [Kiritimatiellia bacterium]|nr:family 10 glycosylhydrolase [Kiritimatiellia bacterium]